MQAVSQAIAAGKGKETFFSRFSGRNASLLTHFRLLTYKTVPGGSVVKTSASNGGGAVSNPGQGVKISHASWQKKHKKKQKKKTP